MLELLVSKLVMRTIRVKPVVVRKPNGRNTLPIDSTVVVSCTVDAAPLVTTVISPQRLRLKLSPAVFVPLVLLPNSVAQSPFG